MGTFLIGALSGLMIAGFAAIYAVVLLGARAAQEYLGDRGLLVTAVVSGAASAMSRSSAVRARSRAVASRRRRAAKW